MVVVIARIGNLALRRKTYLMKKELNTHDIEIVKYAETEAGTEYCYSIADFNDEGELVSSGSRLLEVAATVDIHALQTLEKIGMLIISTDAEKTDYEITPVF